MESITINIILLKLYLLLAVVYEKKMKTAMFIFALSLANNSRPRV